MIPKLAALGRKHPKLVGIAFTATFLTSQLLFEYDIGSAADTHPGP